MCVMYKIFLTATLAICSTVSFAANDQSLINEAKKGIKYQLKDPTSVLFRDVRVVKNTEGKKTVCGEVNAKNIYGGYVGFKSFYGSSIIDSDNEIMHKIQTNSYNQAGCAGQVAELAARKQEFIERTCKANLEFIRFVIKDRIEPESAYTQLLSTNERYYRIFKFTPSKESLFEELANISSNKSKVREVKNNSYSFGEEYTKSCEKNLMN